jgi:hypothetical protein
MKRIQFWSVIFLTACIVIGAGMKAHAVAYGSPTQAVPLPGPLGPTVEAPYGGVGVSFGSLWPGGANLDAGFYAAGQFSFWFNPYVAVELGVGRATLDDNIYGGQFEINPIAGYVVLSLPLASDFAGMEFLNFRFAVGGGVLSIRHEFVGVEDETFFALQAGVEWQFPKRTKLFIIADTIWAGDVAGTRPIFDPSIGGPAIPTWDLRFLTALRVGVEFSF